MSIKCEEFDQLPFMLNAKDLVRILRLSRSEAYAYMHSKGFPTTTLGSRMLVRKDTTRVGRKTYILLRSSFNR